MNIHLSFASVNIHLYSLWLRWIITIYCCQYSTVAFIIRWNDSAIFTRGYDVRDHREISVITTDIETRGIVVSKAWFNDRQLNHNIKNYTWTMRAFVSKERKESSVIVGVGQLYHLIKINWHDVERPCIYYCDTIAFSQDDNCGKTCCSE